jgi:hypothetical protein
MQTVAVYSENKTNSVGEIWCWMLKRAVHSVTAAIQRANSFEARS